jgi:hypothetical protein
MEMLSREGNNVDYDYETTFLRLLPLNHRSIKMLIFIFIIMQGLKPLKSKLIRTIEQMKDDASLTSPEHAIQEAMLNAELFARIDRLADTPKYSWEEVKNMVLKKNASK